MTTSAETFAFTKNIFILTIDDQENPESKSNAENLHEENIGACEEISGSSGFVKFRFAVSARPAVNDMAAAPGFPLEFAAFHTHGKATAFKQLATIGVEGGDITITVSVCLLATDGAVVLLDLTSDPRDWRVVEIFLSGATLVWLVLTNCHGAGSSSLFLLAL